MYSDKENIQQLTALLKAYGIDRVVVCAGSRNAPMIHNFKEAGMKLYGATDERSAGFMALGMGVALGQPVAVCVTSGSALLNLAPSVAEAAYRHQGIVVISADRPADRIGQLEGQTIKQPGVFGDHARVSVTLHEPKGEEESRQCTRLINEALMNCSDAPVHINVHISEPMFGYTSECLPTVTKIERTVARADYGNAVNQIAERITKAKRPMIVVGQMKRDIISSQAIKALSEKVVTLYEALSSTYGGCRFEQAEIECGMAPDFILHCGDTLVSKRLKQFLSDAPGAETWVIAADGNIHDIYGNQTRVIAADAGAILQGLATCNLNSDPDFYNLWAETINKGVSRLEGYRPRYSQMLAVKELERQIGESGEEIAAHYANSTAVRLGNMYARHYIYVNRGVNGIEGSLSTAAGHSMAWNGTTVCVTGDLSFFYDCNALWNEQLGGNLRIMLLNNGGGAIFHTIGGIENDTAINHLIMGLHRATAEGICRSYDAVYLRADGQGNLHEMIDRLLSMKSTRPVVLEVITDGTIDATELNKIR